MGIMSSRSTTTSSCSRRTRRRSDSDCGELVRERGTTRTEEPRPVDTPEVMTDTGARLVEMSSGLETSALTLFRRSAYLREASTATCPSCGHVVELDTVIVEGDVWRLT